MPSSNNGETRFRRLWYGPKAKVTIGPGFIHKSGFGTLMIPHPPIANWLLRKGVLGQSSRDLSFAHEFAHFQTAPVLLLYLLAILILVDIGGHMSIGAVLFVLASVQAAWEMASEGLVILKDSTTYRMSYNSLNWLPRALFWATGGLLTTAGWMVVLHR